MLTLILMRGLPASGKSTLADKILQQDVNTVRVNKDEIRELLSVDSSSLEEVFDREILRRMTFMSRNHDSGQNIYIDELRDELLRQFSLKKDDFMKSKTGNLSPRENLVINIQTVCICYAVSQRRNLVIDDTNGNPKHRTRIEGLCCGYTLKVIDMHLDYGITLQQCLERNAARKRIVPRAAILGMAKQFILPQGSSISQFQQVSQNKKYDTHNKVVVCDIDGTLADISHRVHLVDRSNNQKPRWTDFFSKMADDTLRHHVKSLLHDTYADCDVVLVSARPEDYRTVTEERLKKHGVRYNALIMRRAGDYRPDTVVKQEIIDNYLPKMQIVMWIDDRRKVIEQVRKNNIPVLDVSEGKGNF